MFHNSPSPSGEPSTPCVVRSSTVTQTHAVSSDGKTDTITGTSANAQGQTVNMMRVYDKQ